MIRIRHLLLGLTVSFALACASAGARVPEGFVGMNADGPLFNSNISLPHQLDRMVASGVESLRATFNWSAAQPSSSGPIDFSATDRIVRLAAQRGLTVLPDVLYAPDWDVVTAPPGSYPPPRDNAPYANYVKQLVLRYGLHGSFWRANPGVPQLPIRMWQIWNEPNIRGFWPVQPFATNYVSLLKAAHAAIKSVDQSAKVVLAGMPGLAWSALSTIYAVPGARGAFDVVAAHPYTTRASDVIKFLTYVRNVMDRNGDARKPLLATEVGWPSAVGHTPSRKLFGFETTEAGQASKLEAVIPMLASARHRLGLLGFDYYTWVGREYYGAYTFQFAGLFRISTKGIFAKPAFAAFSRAALAIESCRVKAAVATRCKRSG